MTKVTGLAFALSAALALAGCQNMSDSPLAPNGPGTGALDAKEGNGRGGGPGPGGGATADVTLGGGITGSGSATVVADSNSTLELSGDSVTASLSLSGTLSAAECESAGAFGTGDHPVYETMLGYLGSAQGSMGTLIVDKTSETSTSHRLALRNWTQPGVTGNFTVWIDDPSYSSKAPVPSGGNLTPRVTSVDSGTTTTYTFHGGDGVVLLKHVHGKPKDHPVIVCRLQDDVTVAVAPS